jgi:hypothetical protein
VRAIPLAGSDSENMLGVQWGAGVDGLEEEVKMELRQI